MGLFQPTQQNHPVLMNQLRRQYFEESTLFGYLGTYMRPIEVEKNGIFSESTSRNFLSENGTDVFYKRETDEEYGGAELFGGFGLMASYKMVIYISALYFKDNNLPAPIEGDVFLDRTDNLLFEISKVDPLDENQLSIRINDSFFAYKCYLKSYEWSYKDSIQEDLTEDFEQDFLDADLDNINDALNNDIILDDSIDDNDLDAIFGEFG